MKHKLKYIVIILMAVYFVFFWKGFSIIENVDIVNYCSKELKDKKEQLDSIVNTIIEVNDSRNNFKIYYHPKKSEVFSIDLSSNDIDGVNDGFYNLKILNILKSTRYSVIVNNKDIYIDIKQRNENFSNIYLLHSKSMGNAMFVDYDIVSKGFLPQTNEKWIYSLDDFWYICVTEKNTTPFWESVGFKIIIVLLFLVFLLVFKRIRWNVRF